MLSNDLKYVNVAIKIEVYTTWEFKTFNFLLFFFNFINFTYLWGKLHKIGRHVAKDHSKGSVSQIFDLGPSSYFMKSKKIE